MKNRRKKIKNTHFRPFPLYNYITYLYVQLACMQPKPYAFFSQQACIIHRLNPAAAILLLAVTAANDGAFNATDNTKAREQALTTISVPTCMPPFLGRLGIARRQLAAVVVHRRQLRSPPLHLRLHPLHAPVQAPPSNRRILALLHRLPRHCRRHLRS